MSMSTVSYFTEVMCMISPATVSQMWAAMAKIRKKYLVAFIRVDQAHLGDPALRRRVYIILVRRLQTIHCMDKLHAQDWLWKILLDFNLIHLFMFNQHPDRDIAMGELWSHNDLEKHCESTYQMLKENQPAPPTLPLDDPWVISSLENMVLLEF